MPIQYLGFGYRPIATTDRIPELLLHSVLIPLQEVFELLINPCITAACVDATALLM